MLLYLCLGMIVGGGTVTFILGKWYLEKRQINQNKEKVIELLYRWIDLKQKGKNLQEYFLRRNYYNIAVFGMSSMGERLYDELKDTDLNVCYGIDQGEIDFYKDLKITSLDTKLETVDIIIVCDFIDFFSIESVLKNKINCAIVPIDDIIYEVG